MDLKMPGGAIKLLLYLPFPGTLSSSGLGTSSPSSTVSDTGRPANTVPTGFSLPPPAVTTDATGAFTPGYSASLLEMWMRHGFLRREDNFVQMEKANRGV